MCCHTEKLSKFTRQEILIIFVYYLHSIDMKQERGVWAKKSKPSRRGSISGAPYKTAKGDRAEGWCGGVYEVAAGVGLCACKM